MSLNIQTSTGLLEIGGSVTKEKVISALEYVPANETHVEDADVHVSSEDRQTWDNKSDFSGAYADLLDAPNITEDNSGNVVIADESGNIIMKVDASGLETTVVTAKSAVINGVDVEAKLNEHKEEIDGINEDLTTVTNSLTEKASKTDLDSHTSNQSNPHNVTASQVGLGNVDNTSDANKPVSTAQQEALDALKSELSESIVSESEEWTIVDNNGNIVAKVNSNGLETTQVIADTVMAGGTDVGSTLSTHTGNTNIHITADERTAWNAKATTTYVDEKVAGIVNSAPETLNTLDELAAALGDDANFATTVATQIGTKANQSSLDDHTSNTTIHVTSTERDTWNAKATTTYVEESLDSLKSELSESIVSTAEEWTVADNSGNIIARVDANGLETTTVTAQAVVINGTDVETALDNITSGTTVVQEAVHAESANEADHADSADEATHSVSADTATTATTAASATKATQDASGNVITSTYETKTDASAKLDTAKSYADGLIAALDVSDTAVSGQYVTAVSETNGKISVSRTALPDYSSTYAPISHSHAISDVTNLQSTLDGKAAKATTLSGYGITDAASKTHSHAIADVTDLQTTIDTLNSTIAGKADSGHSHSAATTSAAGFMSASDKSKLDGITASADSVSFSRSLSSGTKIGTLTINGTGTDLYCQTNTDTHLMTKTTVGTSGSTSNEATSNGSVYLNVFDEYTMSSGSGSYTRSKHNIAGSGATTVESDENGNITINSPNYSLSSFGVTSTAAELNTLDGITATVTELNYMDGVTSNVQTQLDALNSKADNFIVTINGDTADKTYAEIQAAYNDGKAIWAVCGDFILPLIKLMNVSSGYANLIFRLTSHTDGRIYTRSVSITTDGNGNDTVTYTTNEDNFVDATFGITTAGTGAAYTATVSGITSLTAGASFIMIPHTVSTSTAPTLNVNSLGAKTIRRMVSNSSTSTAVGYNAGWLGSGKPVRVTYNGTFWIATELTKPSAADMSGTLGISNGGTGATSAANARTNLGAAAAWDLLWENASPTSAFAAQTISGLGDLSVYSHLMFDYYGTTDANFALSSIFPLKEEGEEIVYLVAPNVTTDLYCMIRSRKTFINSDRTSITFNSGIYGYSKSAGANSDSTIIPWRIFGITV